MKRIVLVLAIFVAGCSAGRPKAPALGNEPVYHNVREGLRFAAPEGWTQAAKADLPPGRLDSEKLLVRYLGLSGDAPGTLEVSCADLLEATNLAEYLAGPSHSIKTWKPVGQPEALQVSNHEAKRFTFRTGDMMKEIVTCRRGERVFFFYGLYSAKDPKSRDQLRQCVGSVVWEK